MRDWAQNAPELAGRGVPLAVPSEKSRNPPSGRPSPQAGTEAADLMSFGTTGAGGWCIVMHTWQPTSPAHVVRHPPERVVPVQRPPASV